MTDLFLHVFCSPTETVPEGRCPASSEWGSSFAAAFHPGWQTGHSAPSPQHSSPSCTCLWRPGTSAESQTPGTGPAASECMPHLRQRGIQWEESSRKAVQVEITELMLWSTHCIQLCVIYHSVPLTHSKAIVCESSSSFVLLVEFLFAADGVLHKIHRL